MNATPLISAKQKEANPRLAQEEFAAPRMKQNVAIDARWLVGGIGTYVKCLLEGISKIDTSLNLQAITRLEHANCLKSYCTRTKIVNAPIYTLREQLMIPFAANGCDLLHVPHFNAPYFFRGKLIVTIHDLIHITVHPYKNKFSSHFYVAPMMSAAIRKAAHVITVSEFTKQEIMRHFPVPSSKITVIHNGVSPRLRRSDQFDAKRRVATALNLRHPFILFVGSAKPHKNFSALWKAMSWLRSEGKWHNHKIGFVDAGPKPCHSFLAELDPPVKSIVSVLSDLEDHQLADIYSAADVLVMPSISEGFGLPVAEAMTCGTPVICSRVASLPEVAGDAAIYFDPGKPEELAAKIDQVLACATLQESLRTKGFEQAKLFSTEQFIKKHVEVYLHVLNLNLDVSGTNGTNNEAH